MIAYTWRDWMNRKYWFKAAVMALCLRAFSSINAREDVRMPMHSETSSGVV